MRAIARAHTLAHTQTYLHMLFVARMKSHIQPKRSCSQNILLSILCLCLRVPSWNNAVYVNSVSQVLITMTQRPHRSGRSFFFGFLCIGFQFRYFFENRPSLYCIYIYYFKHTIYSTLCRFAHEKKIFPKDLVQCLRLTNWVNMINMIYKITFSNVTGHLNL